MQGEGTLPQQGVRPGTEIALVEPQAGVSEIDAYLKTLRNSTGEQVGEVLAPPKKTDFITLDNRIGLFTEAYVSISTEEGRGEWLKHLKGLLDRCGYTMDENFEKSISDNSISSFGGIDFATNRVTAYVETLWLFKKTKLTKTVTMYRVKEGFIESRPRPQLTGYDNPKTGE